MSYRRVIQISTITFIMALLLPHAAAADDGRHESANVEGCHEADNLSDDGHNAGERDRAHEHEGHEKREAGDEHEPEDAEDDCVITPPAEVPEAPKALLLSASAVLTGGAAVLAIRRRSRGATSF